MCLMRKRGERVDIGMHVCARAHVCACVCLLALVCVAWHSLVRVVGLIDLCLESLNDLNV